MQDTWKWLVKAVGTTLTPRRLIMFGLVFLFAFRRGVVKIIQSHILPLSMDPSKKETIQRDGPSAKSNDDQELAAHKSGTNSSKDEKTVSKTSGSGDEQRAFDLALTLSRDKAKPSIVTQSSIILRENLPTQSHASKTKTESSGVNEKCHIDIDDKGDMPPKRKRRTSRDDTKSKKPKEDCKVRTLHSCNSADDDLSKPFSLRKCRSWFLEYAAQDDPETIGPDGIERLCHDLAVDPENVVMLVVAWKLQAEKLGFFKFTEWSKGMGNLECDSTAKLQARLGSLSTILRDNPTFKKIYRYAFDFCRNPDQRTLDIDTAMAMLRVLLKGKWSLIEHFLEFMQQSKYKVINRDQWCNVLEFSRSISTDLSNYDEDGAWPVLMDEFVEWYRTNYQNTTETST